MSVAAQSTTPTGDPGKAGLRILYIVSTFCRHEGEMQNPWMLETILRLQQRGHSVHVLAPSFRGLASHRIGDIPVQRFRYFFRAWEDLTHDHGATTKIRGSLLYKAMFFPYVFFGVLAAFRQARRQSFDIVHVHWPFPHGLLGVAAVLGSRAPRPRLVLNFHGASLLLAKTYAIVGPLLRWMLRRADGLVANSSFTAAAVRELQADAEIAVIAFGTPLESNASPLPGNAVKQILVVGRLIERKGVEYLIRALPAILQRHEACLHIVGAGDETVLARLKAVTTELELGRHVCFHGIVAAPELSGLYKQCDVFCLPAIIDSAGDTEGLGVVLLEAMSYARPVVGSDVGGIPDVIKPGETGLLCQQRNPQDLADKIQAILDDPALAERLAMGGYEYARTEFGWNRIMAKWDDFYADVMATGTTR